MRGPAKAPFSIPSGGVRIPGLGEERGPALPFPPLGEEGGSELPFPPLGGGEVQRFNCVFVSY